MVILFTCNKAETEVKDFADLVKLHSNISFEKKSVNNDIYYTFDEVKAGYMYLTVDSKAKSCIEMKVKKIQKELGEEIITDYIKSSSPSVFDIPDAPSHNFRIDISIKTVNEFQIED